MILPFMDLIKICLLSIVFWTVKWLQFSSFSQHLPAWRHDIKDHIIGFLCLNYALKVRFDIRFESVIKTNKYYYNTWFYFLRKINFKLRKKKGFKIFYVFLGLYKIFSMNIHYPTCFEAMINQISTNYVGWREHINLFSNLISRDLLCDLVVNLLIIYLW